jgi:DNA end-binding protein Ku
MARALWSGSLSFGLVNVPVAIISAVRDVDLHFRQLHEKDGAPIDVQRWCSAEDVEVPFEEVAHGYELEDGRQVVISDDELAAVEPRRTRTIDIEQFVAAAEVDPIYFDHPYLLVPSPDDDGAARAYGLLTEVMRGTDRAALGRFVMRAKEYLVIVRARERALTLSTMLFADELRSLEGVDTAARGPHRPERKQLEAAVTVIEELSTEWDPARYKDRYRARLRRVVDRKRKGHTVKAPAIREQREGAPDLMDALERTLAEMRGGECDQKKKTAPRSKRQRQEAR